jgi:hypothetical protein
LTLATVAATTLATGTAAWAIAFGAVLTFFLQLLFVGGQLFFGDGSGLLGTWLTLFTRWAWSAFFAWLAGRTLFSGRCSGRSSIQRLTQFTNTLFAFATWLTVFTRGARRAFFSRSTWCAFFACYGRCLFTGFAWLTLFAWLTWCALFTRCTFFTWCTFFAGLAFFITATVTVAALLATVATLFFVATGRTLSGSRLLDHGRSGRLFLGGEQADQ